MSDDQIAATRGLTVRQAALRLAFPPRRFTGNCLKTCVHQLGPHIDQDINERQMALEAGIDLASPIDCARLSFHGGCFAVRLSPRFAHHLCITSSEGAAASIFNSYRDIPSKPPATIEWE